MIKSANAESHAARHKKWAVAALIMAPVGFCTVGLLSLLGLIICVVLLFVMARSEAQANNRSLAMTGVVYNAISLLAAMVLLVPALAGAKKKSSRIGCVIQLKQLGLDLRIYSEEHNGVLPAGSNWCDALSTSTPPRIFRCPVRKDSSRSHYAFNARLSALRQSQINPKTVLLFECAGGWNVSGGRELLADKPHVADFVNVGFVDGIM